MAINTERLRELAKPRDERAHKEFLERWDDRAWLTYSQDIALALHYYMRVNEMTQRELADKMDVSSVYISKLLKGEENLTLETICKLQSVIGEKLINIARPYEPARTIELAKLYNASDDIEISPIYSKNISIKNKYQRVHTRMVAY